VRINRPLRFVIAAFVTAVAAAPAAAATCPFNIPVVTLPPHTVAGFSWGSVIRPMGDACIAQLEVDPANDNAWYAGGQNGLYMTKNGGVTWTKPVNGHVTALLLVPGQPTLVYAGVGNKLYLSRTNGRVWTVIHTFAKSVQSVLVAGGTLYVGLGWNNHVDPSGVFTSNLGGGGMVFHPFGPGQTGLIVWTLARDPLSGTIYAGTEIYDHPQPYKPPFFRSSDNGVTWTNVAGTLPWHVVDSAVRPSDGYVYALTEGTGVHGSPNQGGSWTPPLLSPGLGIALTMDPNAPTRLYAGRQKFGTLTGGIFRSTDAGAQFSAIGLDGVTIGDIALNGTVTRIYAAAYGSGIYRATIP
jgi:hypothetical protein